MRRWVVQTAVRSDRGHMDTCWESGEESGPDWKKTVLTSICSTSATSCGTSRANRGRGLQVSTAFAEQSISTSALAGIRTDCTFTQQLFGKEERDWGITSGFC